MSLSQIYLARTVYASIVRIWYSSQYTLDDSCLAGAKKKRTGLYKPYYEFYSDNNKTTTTILRNSNVSRLASDHELRGRCCY